MKYRLTLETREYFGRTLHRIVCVTAFSDVAVGEVGGWIESEKNLSQYDKAWVYDNAVVCDNAVVRDNAVVCGRAVVRDNAVVCDNAWVCDNAVVRDNAVVCDNAWVRDNAVVSGRAVVRDNAVVSGRAVVRENADYIVLKNTWSSGRYFTYTVSNDKWTVGCFHGTGEELIAKAYKDSELSGDCYKAAVEFVEKIKEAKKKANATEEKL